MKTILLLLITFISLHAAAQTEAYYDYTWKPCKPEQARFYSLVSRTDSGWLRYDYFLGTRKLQMAGLFEDSANKIANGFFHFYYANGIPESFGRNVHNKKEGLWMRYYPNGMTEDSTMYVNGNPTGTSMGWHSNGYLADSVVYSPDGSAVEVDWYSNGYLSGAGRSMNGHLNGPWQFFYSNGKLAARENYDIGKLESRQYYNTEGVLEDTTSKDCGATFPGGSKGWQKFVYKHIYFPSQYKLVNGNEVTVVVMATIDEEGNVLDPFVEIPFDKNFDHIAIDIFKKSPKWLPAIRHNRPVVQTIRQPITFSQSE
jgi:antitoxin component YwqK of YwqJK toxin-antitoxin module